MKTSKESLYLGKTVSYTEFDSMYKEQGFTLYDHGTIIVIDKVTGEVMLIVEFEYFASMSTKKFKKYERASTLCFRQTQVKSKVGVNSAHKDGGGDMYAAGWRRDYIGGGFTIGTTCTKNVDDQIQVDKEAAEIGTLYQEFFETLSPSIYVRAVEEQQQLGAPVLCDPLFDQTNSCMDSFGSNLSITTNHSYNIGHYDKDVNTYTFGVFYPIHKNTGYLAKQKEGYDGEGNYFIFDTLRIVINLNKCDGVVRII